MKKKWIILGAALVLMAVGPCGRTHLPCSSCPPPIFFQCSLSPWQAFLSRPAFYLLSFWESKSYGSGFGANKSPGIALQFRVFTVGYALIRLIIYWMKQVKTATLNKLLKDSPQKHAPRF